MRSTYVSQGSRPEWIRQMTGGISLAGGCDLFPRPCECTGICSKSPRWRQERRLIPVVKAGNDDGFQLMLSGRSRQDHSETQANEKTDCIFFLTEKQSARPPHVFIIRPSITRRVCSRFEQMRLQRSSLRRIQHHRNADRHGCDFHSRCHRGDR